MIILVKPSQFILSNPLQAHKHFITLHHQLYNWIPSSTDTSNIYIHNKARMVNLSFSIDIFKKLIRIQLVMVYEMQGCQFIRPDSVNLSGLNDYNISSDQRSSTWMHHEQLHLVIGEVLHGCITNSCMLYVLRWLLWYSVLLLLKNIVSYFPLIMM